LAVTHHAGSGYYRYRGTTKPDKTALQAEKLRKLLKANRQRLAFNASSSRPLSARLNQHVAQALRDGMKVTRLAETAGLSRWTIRTIGLSFDDLVQSGEPPENQCPLIESLRAELAELEKSKAVLEAHRLKLLAAARKLGVMDDFELAALSGLHIETVRKLTWGLQSQTLA
jgi:hypothetical protein